MTVIGTDPEIATDGATVATLNEAEILTKVAAVWTILAKMMYPEATA